MGPVAARGSFRVVVNRLYYGKKDIATPHASHATHLIDAGTIAEVLQSIYRREFNPQADIEPHLFRAFAEKMAEAVDKGYTANAAPSPDDAFRNALRHSADVFAAFKTHRTQSDMAAQLLDSNGNLKPFEQWKNDVQPIASHQCGAWLETEYNTAVLRARQAADWQQFEAEKDVLPNLKWLPSTSPNPGADHLPFWNTILPIEHPFWNQHRPGDRWNCKCELTSTDEPTTAVPKTPHPSGGAGGGSNPHRGLADNPGKTKSVFSQDHPYFPKNCNACPFYKPGFRAKLRALFYNQKKNCTGNCPYVRGVIDKAKGYIPDADYGRRLLVHERADQSELTDNVRTAKSLLDSFKDMTIKIREHVIAHKVSNPEYEINGFLADRKGLESEKGISSGFSRAIEQGCQFVVIDFDQRMRSKILKTKKLSNKIYNRHKDFDEGLITECYVVYHGKAVLIDATKFIPNDKEKSIGQIRKTLDELI